MSKVNQMIENIGKLYPESVKCYRMGNFYQCFGKDTYIMSYLFNYKINYIKNDIPITGFPKKAISKVQAKLEQKKINYIFIDVRNNYDIDVESNNGNLNIYKKFLIEASYYVKIQNRINLICKELTSNINKPDIKNKIEKIEEIVYENRKI